MEIKVINTEEDLFATSESGEMLDIEKLARFLKTERHYAEFIYHSHKDYNYIYNVINKTNILELKLNEIISCPIFIPEIMKEDISYEEFIESYRVWGGKEIDIFFEKPTLVYVNDLKVNFFGKAQIHSLITNENYFNEKALLPRWERHFKKYYNFLIGKKYTIEEIDELFSLFFVWLTYRYRLLHIYRKKKPVPEKIKLEPHKFTSKHNKAFLQILEEIKQYIPFNIGTLTDNMPFYEFIIHNFHFWGDLWTLYNIKLNTADEKKLKDKINNVIEVLKRAHEYKERLREEKKDLTYRKSQNAIYDLMYYNIYGKSQYKKLTKYTELYKILSDDEKKHLLQEFNKFYDETNEMMKILTQIRNTGSNILRSKLFKQIQSKLPSNFSNDTWIKDENGNILLCPHVYKELDFLVNSDRSHDEIKNIIIEEFRGKGNSCRICHEVIVVENELPDFKERTRHGVYANQEIKKKIWKVVMQILNSQIEFSRKYFISNNAFVNQAISTLTPFIEKAHVDILKNKNLTSEKKQLQLYYVIYLYVYAYISKQIFTNPDKIKYKAEYFAFEKTPAKQIIGHAVGLILSTQTNIVSELDFNREDVRRNFITVYRSLSNIGINTHIAEQKQKKASYLLDPIFFNVYFYDPVKGNTTEEMKKNLAKLNYRQIFSDPKVYLFENIPLNRPILPDMEKIEISNLRRYLNMFRANGSFIIRNYVKRKVYESPFYKIVENEKAFMTSSYEQFYEIIAPLVEAENKIRSIWKLYSMIPYEQVPLRKGIKYIYGNVLSGVVYGLPIHKHDWGKYIYIKKYKGNDIKKYKKDEYIIDDKFCKDCYLFDTICTICGLTKTEAKKLDIEKELQEHMRKLNFYNYIIKYCPENKKYGFHEKIPCKWCGFKPEYEHELNITYYKKYYKFFLDSIKVVKGEKPKEEVKIEKIKNNFIYKIEDLEYLVKIWYDAINASSDIGEFRGINIGATAFKNLLLNIGLSEGHYIDDIYKGKEQIYTKLKDSEELCRIRIVKLRAYNNDIVKKIISLRYWKYKGAAKYKYIAAHIDENTGKILENLNIDKIVPWKKYSETGDYCKLSEEYLYYFIFVMRNFLKQIEKAPLYTDLAKFIFKGVLESENFYSKLPEDVMNKTLTGQAYYKIDEYEEADNAMSNIDQEQFAEMADIFGYEDMDYEGENEEYNT